MAELRQLAKRLEYAFLLIRAGAAEWDLSALRMRRRLARSSQRRWQRTCLSLRDALMTAWRDLSTDPWQRRMWYWTGVALLLTAGAHPYGQRVAESMGGWPGLAAGLALAFSPVVALGLCIWCALRSWIYQLRQMVIIIGRD